jgi:hypothetical protein
VSVLAGKFEWVAGSALAQWRAGARVEEKSILRTGVAALDELAPGGAFRRGAVHEFLAPTGCPRGVAVALLLVKAALGREPGGRTMVAWSDPTGELYAPALAAAGVDLRRLLVLRPRQPVDELWAVAECLRCPGICATVAGMPVALSYVQARRLQLAAEQGGGVGVFFRPLPPNVTTRVSSPDTTTAHTTRSPALPPQQQYAAATRWRVEPAPNGDGGRRGVKPWRVARLHGHGGQVGRSILLEVDRDTRIMRAPAPLADRPALPAVADAAG